MRGDFWGLVFTATVFLTLIAVAFLCGCGESAPQCGYYGCIRPKQPGAEKCVSCEAGGLPLVGVEDYEFKGD